jgi:hypothetical protein
MNKQGMWVGAVLLSFAGFANAGTGTLPGASLDRPGSDTVGAPPGTDPTTSMWTDTNGDGLMQKSEVKPGSQMEKRFSTRDANKDGTLTRDEYYY